MAAEHRLLTLDEVERCFAYRDNRYDATHDYGKGFAHETLALIPDFIPDFIRGVGALEASLSAGGLGRRQPRYGRSVRGQ